MNERLGGIDDLRESIESAVLQRTGRVAARVQERRGLEADLLETDDEYLVVFDAPGAVSTDVQVRYVEGSVRVRVDRFRDYHEGFEMRFPGRGLSLDGRVDLPADAVVDPDAATATLTDHGTVEVVLPRREDAVAHEDDPVDVDVEDGAPTGDATEADDHEGDNGDNEDTHGDDHEADGDHDH